MLLKITKIEETEKSTLSKLNTEGGEFLGFIIEDGYHTIKEKRETRIPGGRYEIVARKYGRIFEKYQRRYGHDFSIQIKEVPNFKHILIHIGNDIDDTEGCPLINYEAVYHPHDAIWEGQTSTKAYLHFYQLVAAAFAQQQKVFIDIER